MKREFLESMGLDKETVDKIMQENGNDINAEKRKTEAAEAKATTANNELEAAQNKLTAAQGELDALKASNGDIAKAQQQLTELQAKYETDTADLKGQLAARDYSDAINKAISDKGLKFSSKGAQSAFVAALKEKKLELKDGSLDGLDDFIKSQKESDPDAFAPDKPAPRFATGAGGGAGGHGNPNQTMTTAELMAQNIGKATAESGKAANNIISMYTGGAKNGT